MAVFADADDLQNSVSSAILAYPGGVTIGDVLWCAVVIYANSANHTPVGSDFTDTQGNTWGLLHAAPKAHSGTTIGIATTKAGSTGANTVTYAHGSSNSIIIAIGHITATASSSWEDGAGNHNSGTGTSATSGSMTPSQDGYGLACGSHEAGGTVTLTGANGWSVIIEREDTSGIPYAVVSRTTTNSVAVDATITLGASADWTMAGGLIKGSGAGPSGANQQAMMMGVG